MSIFRSQFDRARGYADAYAGPAGDPGWRTPAAAAGLVVGGAVVAALAVDAVASAAPPEAWGEGWEAGWDTGAAGFPAGPDPAADDGAWLDRGDYTGAGVGGDEDFFYFIDGDSSLTIG